MQETIEKFFGAICKNDIELVRSLIKEGIDINLKNEHGDTALHYASFFNCKDIIIELIKAGADINTENNVGNTPLDVARNQEYKEAELILSGVKIDDKQTFGISIKTINSKLDKIIELLTNK